MSNHYNLLSAPCILCPRAALQAASRLPEGAGMPIMPFPRCQIPLQSALRFLLCPRAAGVGDANPKEKSGCGSSVIHPEKGGMDGTGDKQQ